MEERLYNILEKYKDTLPLEVLIELTEFQFILGEYEGESSRNSKMVQDIFPLLEKYRSKEPIFDQWITYWDGY